MKRMLAFALVFVLVFVACSSSKKEEAITNFASFEEKYKRADFDAFLNDPSDFIDDYRSLNSHSYVSPDFCDFSDGWVERDFSSGSDDGDLQFTRYEKDLVLFNRSASVSCSVIVRKSDDMIRPYFMISFDTGDFDENFKIAKSLSMYLFEKYSDDSEVSVDEEASSEAVLRKLFNGAVDYTAAPDFEIEWSDCSLHFINCLSRLDGHYVYSSVSLYVHSEVEDAGEA